MMEPTDVKELVNMLRNDVRELRTRLDALEVRVGKTVVQPPVVDFYPPKTITPPTNNINPDNPWNDINLPSRKQIATYERFIGKLTYDNEGRPTIGRREIWLKIHDYFEGKNNGASSTNGNEGGDK